MSSAWVTRLAYWGEQRRRERSPQNAVFDFFSNMSESENEKKDNKSRLKLENRQDKGRPSEM